MLHLQVSGISGPGDFGDMVCIHPVLAGLLRSVVALRDRKFYVCISKASYLSRGMAQEVLGQQNA